MIWKADQRKKRGGEMLELANAWSAESRAASLAVRRAKAAERRRLQIDDIRGKLARGENTTEEERALLSEYTATQLEGIENIPWDAEAAEGAKGLRDSQEWGGGGELEVLEPLEKRQAESAAMIEDWAAGEIVLSPGDEQVMMETFAAEYWEHNVGEEQDQDPEVLMDELAQSLDERAGESDDLTEAEAEFLEWMVKGGINPWSEKEMAADPLLVVNRDMMRPETAGKDC